MLLRIKCPSLSCSSRETRRSPTDGGQHSLPLSGAGLLLHEAVYCGWGAFRLGLFTRSALLALTHLGALLLLPLLSLARGMQVPLLDSGDIIIDGGNSEYRDTTVSGLALLDPAPGAARA